MVPARGARAGRATPFSLPHVIKWRRDRGQTAMEYVGLIAVVAAIILALALSGVGGQITNGLQSAICSLTGSSCPATGDGGETVEAGSDTEDQPGPTTDGGTVVEAVRLVAVPGMTRMTAPATVRVAVPVAVRVMAPTTARPAAEMTPAPPAKPAILLTRMSRSPLMRTGQPTTRATTGRRRRRNAPASSDAPSISSGRSARACSSTGSGAMSPTCGTPSSTPSTPSPASSTTGNRSATSGARIPRTPVTSGPMVTTSTR